MTYGYSIVLNSNRPVITLTYLFYAHVSNQYKTAVSASCIPLIQTFYSVLLNMEKVLMNFFLWNFPLTSTFLLHNDTDSTHSVLACRRVCVNINDEWLIDAVREDDKQDIDRLV